MKLKPVKTAVGPPAVDEPITPDEAAAMARAVIRLFRLWNLTDAQACRLLGGISIATYNRWKRGEIGRIGVDLATRLSDLMGIHKSLRLLFTDKERAHGWIARPNAVFDGRSALDVMLGGRVTDLMRVRHYLDAVRG